MWIEEARRYQEALLSYAEVSAKKPAFMKGQCTDMPLLLLAAPFVLLSEHYAVS